MPNSRKNLANSALQKALQRLHYPLEVMLTSYGQKTPSASGERLGQGVWVVKAWGYLIALYYLTGVKCAVV